MDSTDLRVLRSARDWHMAGHHLLLVTVVKTWGSSPRPAGSMMVLRADGRCEGSVSGGCIEEDLIHQYRNNIQPGRPVLRRYGVNADEAHRFGLPCGGTLELLLEFQPDRVLLDTLVCQLEAGQLMQRSIDCDSGVVNVQALTELKALFYDGKKLITTLGPQYRLLIIGAGILAEYLATMALFNNFAVTVCDPRRDYIDGWSVAGVSIIRQMPDDAVVSLAPDRHTCVVALSHDPKLDDLALLEALHSPAFYVGAIGSRRNTDSRRRRFIQYFGETEASLASLRAPVGLYIGSRTPAEIAVSVMAEILAVKNSVKLPAGLSVAIAKARQQEVTL